MLRSNSLFFASNATPPPFDGILESTKQPRYTILPVASLHPVHRSLHPEYYLFSVSKKCIFRIALLFQNTEFNSKNDSRKRTVLCIKRHDSSFRWHSGVHEATLVHVITSVFVYQKSVFVGSKYPKNHLI